MLLETVVAALVPVAADGVKTLFNRWSGGVKPLTIDDQIKLDNSEIERLKTVAQLDNPGGTPSQWVVDLRASSRYVLGGMIIASTCIAAFIPGVNAEALKLMIEASNIVFGFLFGSRLVASWRK